MNVLRYTGTKNTKRFWLFLFVNLSLTIPGICQQDGYIAIDNGVIHFKKFGNGEPLLIINGGPGLDCEGFLHLAEMLSDSHMTILFDQRGTGKSRLSRVDSATVTMDLMASDIETLRRYLNINKWIILGHSFGGFLAEYYAVCFPESIRAMI